MSQFYDLASLVVIPSGYKASTIYAQKPLTTDGQLSFTRASGATRVGPNGLIEEVRTNLFTFSQDFSNASWIFDPLLTRTLNQTDPNGGTTAALYSATAGSNLTFGKNVNLVANAPNTVSIWIKGTTSGSVSLRIDDSTLGTQTNINYTTSWQRFSVTRTVNRSDCQFVVGGFSTWGAGENIFFAFAQAEAGDIATNYIPTTTAAVSVGPVNNLPRLDYTNSSCPRLLLEPQRTNAIIFSEQFNNANWTKSGNGVGSAPVITANAAISPDGYQNADKIDLALNGGTSSSDWSWVFQTYTVTANQPQAVSIYLKAATAGDVGKKIRVGIISYIEHTLTTNWTRVELIQTVGSTGAYSVGFRLRGSEVTANSVSFFAYGAQLEQNAPYVSSYIPTLSASVTRVLDSNLDFSALVNNTSFTFFLEASFAFADGNFFDARVLTAGGNYLGFYNGFVSIYNLGAGTTVFGSPLAANTNHKVLFKYDGANAKFYRNGTLLRSVAATSVGTFVDGLIYNADQEGLKIKQFLYFPTALTDAQCVELTTL